LPFTDENTEVPAQSQSGRRRREVLGERRGKDKLKGWAGERPHVRALPGCTPGRCHRPGCSGSRTDR